MFMRLITLTGLCVCVMSTACVVSSKSTRERSVTTVEVPPVQNTTTAAPTPGRSGPPDRPPAQAPPSSNPSSAPANASGTMGGKPFVARSAVMVRTNAPFRKCSSAMTGTGGCSTDKDGFDVKISTIRILERPVSCATLGDQFGRKDVRLEPNERSIEVLLQGTWPTPPNSMRTTDAQDPTRDYIDVSFKHGFASGAVAKGTIQFVEAKPTDGVMSIRLTTTNPSLPTSGSVSGTIPFVVCN